MVMESTGIYWKGPYAALEAAGIAWVSRPLCKFAQVAAWSRCALKDKFEALRICKWHQKSIMALAHKMLRI